MPFKLPKPVYNADAVKALERSTDQVGQTEITYMQENATGEFKILYARGRSSKQYNKPMFGVYSIDIFSGHMPTYSGCECYALHRTNPCDEHPEPVWDDGLRKCVPPALAEELAARRDADGLPEINGEMVSIINDFNDRMNRQAEQERLRISDVVATSLAETFERLGLPITSPLEARERVVELRDELLAQRLRITPESLGVDPNAGTALYQLIEQSTIQQPNTIEVRYESVQEAAAFFSYEADPGVDGD